VRAIVGERGPLEGVTISLERTGVFLVGRKGKQNQQESCDIYLNHPSISRKHFRLFVQDDGVFIENLSLVNPVLIHRKPLKKKTELLDGMVVQIGSTEFRCILEEAVSSSSSESIIEDLSSGELPYSDSRWLLKVVSGPSAGGEFFLETGKSYVVGKDVSQCDVVFHDRMISHRHLSLTAQEDGTILLEDLESRNGTFIDDARMEESSLPIPPMARIQAGMSAFIIVDMHQKDETLIQVYDSKPEEEVHQKEFSFREISFMLAAFALGLLFLVGGGSLFRGGDVQIQNVDTESTLKKMIEPFRGVHFSYNQDTGDLFLLGYVHSQTKKNELLFALRSLELRNIEDHIVINTTIVDEMNAIFAKNASWQTVNMQACPNSGQFILSGYVEDLPAAQSLQDYVNLYFPYLERFTNRVLVQSLIYDRVVNILHQMGHLNIQVSCLEGNVSLTGTAATSSSSFEEAVSDIRKVHGVRRVNNNVIFSGSPSPRGETTDLSDRYTVTGILMKGKQGIGATINQRVYFLGELIDGMEIADIHRHGILLKQGGLNFTIYYDDAIGGGKG